MAAYNEKNIEENIADNNAQKNIRNIVRNDTRDILMCPVCGQPLLKNEKEAFCENTHRFDRARQGYINLLRSQSSGLGHHGDDRLMLTERRKFLEKGYYAPLRQRVAELAQECLENEDLRGALPNNRREFLSKHDSRDGLQENTTGSAEESVRRDVTGMSRKTEAVLDCGCGEGYYSQYLHSFLNTSGREISMVCLDISREAAKLTARRDFPHETLVASAYELPVLPDSCDLITDIFAPVAEKEFRRVLAPGGILLRVVPEEKHLWELKQAVYDTPYENPPVELELPGFDFMRKESVSYTVNLDSTEDIRSLFRMTPYYYKTSREDQAKLENLTELTTQLSFAILISRK